MYSIRLPVFEGPLDLLLHLIRSHKLDICDVAISQVTEQYLDYLAMMDSLDLDVAGEFLVMAATLSALIWNFFFLPPRFTFYITNFEDAMMFGMYFVIALVLGQLIARLRLTEKAERQREERATALYLLSGSVA